MSGITLPHASPALKKSVDVSRGAPFERALEAFIDWVAPCPWTAHAGARTARSVEYAKRAPLYSIEERQRRDRSIWTRVQAVLAPVQFLAFGISLFLVWRYLATGDGFAAATTSILVKTALLYAIMITGSIWEKDVFGRWLFAKPFFWEDLVSIVVLALHTAYLVALILGLGSPRDQMMLALAAYASYVINAAQYLLKLRAARLEGGARRADPGFARAVR